MKLLFATYLRLKGFHTTVWTDIIDLLVKKYNWKLIDITSIARKFKHRNKIFKRLSLVEELKKHDNVTECFYFNLTIHLSQIFFDLDKIKNIKIYNWIEEIWHDNETAINDSKYMNLIFSPGPRKNLLKYIPNQKDIIHVIFCSCTYNFDLNINFNPRKKILMSGIVNEYYPHREEIMHNYNNNEYFKSLITNLDRNYAKKHNILKKKYAQLINEHIACLVGPGVCDGDYFIVKKFFEIPCTGSLLLIFTDEKSIDDINKIGFINKKNCIIATNFKDLLDQIKFILNDSNRDIIDVIRKNGKKFVLENYMVDHTVKKINKIIENNNNLNTK